MERIAEVRTVLIVDDDPTMLRGLEDNFELRGYRVKTARDGEQGLNITINDIRQIVQVKPDTMISYTSLGPVVSSDFVYYSL